MFNDELVNTKIIMFDSTLYENKSDNLYKNYDDYLNKNHNDYLFKKPDAYKNINSSSMLI